MARINIENELFSDTRFYKLLTEFKGDQSKAIGELVRAWRLAQEYWKKDRSLIPKSRWKDEELSSALIKSRFVEERKQGFYAKGSEKHFAWIMQRIEAGKRGGEAKKRVAAKQSKDSKKSDTKTAPKKYKDNDSGDLQPSGAKRGEPSLLFTPYSKNKKSFTNVKDAELNSADQLSQGKILNKNTQRVVAYYCDLWKYKHGRSPAVKGKDVGILKGLVKDLGVNKVAELLKGFFSIPDSYYVFRGYSVGIFYQNIERIDAFLATGRNITRTKARQVDEEVESEQQVLEWKPAKQLEQ